MIKFLSTAKLFQGHIGITYSDQSRWDRDRHE
jgi:hypothetical protein